MLLLSYPLLESICCFVVLVLVVVLFIVLFNMTVVENIFDNKFGYSSSIWRIWLCSTVLEFQQNMFPQIRTKCFHVWFFFLFLWIYSFSAIPGLRTSLGRPSPSYLGATTLCKQISGPVPRIRSIQMKIQICITKVVYLGM